ncbi:MAG: GNAT family N-acetyltransferase [Roseburia sp.]|nr:GNAT family N-acetyltransferase [Roseburia sp.]
MKLMQRPQYKVEAAILNDAVEFEGAQALVSDDRAAIVKMGELYKCVFEDIRVFSDYAAEYGISGEVCLLGAPPDAPAKIGFSAEACTSFAYFDPLPPPCDPAVTIKRLAPTLAETVHAAYTNPGNADVTHIADIMRDKGVFGAIVNGKLAGFIGRHGDGSMGMLEVFDGFGGRGIGTALEKFMINYVMSFGRTPICDVFCQNAASLALQKKIGLTAADGLTFWFYTDDAHR